MALLVTLLVAAPAPAAAPDGAGPWADSYSAFVQGDRAHGGPVRADRSNPEAALGVAENEPFVDSTFLSLGFGGTVTLGFDNNICNRSGDDFSLELVEQTIESYPQELAHVEVSANGFDFVSLGVVNKDALLDLPDSMAVARYVRLTDVSDRAAHNTNADGYDVDGVRALDTDCGRGVAEGRMTGGGNFQTTGYGKATHGFTLRCSPDDGPNNLTVTWKADGRTQKFKLGSLTSVVCSDDPAIAPPPPAAPFDTYEGIGNGTVNGSDGYDIRFVFSDAGEPGNHDRSTIVITGPDGATVLDTTTYRGNHQAHR